jgi:hypothetical protein
MPTRSEYRVVVTGSYGRVESSGLQKCVAAKGAGDGFENNERFVLENR